MPLPYPRENSLLYKHPDVAGEWHPALNGELDPGIVPASSPLKVMWKCAAAGHAFPASVRNRTYAKSRCPVCVGRRIVSGVNDLATTHPDVAAQWHPSNKKSPSEVGAKSETKFRWKCPVDGYEWDATPAFRTTYGRESKPACPVCVGQAVKVGVNDIFTTVPQWRALWSPKNTTDPNTITAHYAKAVLWRCPTDGYAWESSPHSKWSGGRATMCPACSGNSRVQGSNDLVSTHHDLVKEMKYPSLATTLGAGSGNTEWVCSTCGHEWTASVHSRTSRGGGCAVCAGKVVKAGLNDLATLRPDLAAQWHEDNDRKPTEITLKSNYRAKWRCDKNLSHTWVSTVNNRVHNGSGCGRCWATDKVSRGEREVAEFLSDVLGFGIKQSVRGALYDARAELDITIPTLSVAVEYNGAYFHSTALRPDATQRHHRKWQQCVDKGIVLIQVWDDDWRDRRPVIEHLLRMKLGRGETLPDTDTNAVTLVREEAASFLNRHHVKGNSDSTWYAGVRTADGTLVAVLAARPTRAKNTVEITRYAASHVIDAGFAACVEHIKTLVPERVNRLTIHADLEFSTGELYEGAGFTSASDTPPDFRYLLPSQYARTDRRAFTVKRFREDPALEYEDDMSDEQLAELNGMYRCYDSGTRVFEKRI